MATGNDFKEDDRYVYEYYNGYKPGGLDLREFAKVPWWPIIILFFIAPFFAVVLGVVKIIGCKQETAAEQASARERNGHLTVYTETSSREKITRSRKDAKGAKGAPRGIVERSASRSKVCLVLGIIALIVGVSDIADWLDFFFYVGWSSYMLSDVLTAVGWLIAGIILVYVSNRLKKRSKIIKSIIAIVGKKDNMSMDDIGASLQIDSKETRKYLEECIDNDVFGPGAYLDMRSRYLVVRGPAPEGKPEANAENPAERESTDAAEGIAEETEYQRILRQLREINEAIPGEEMTRKISQIESLTAQIFEIVEKEPEKQPQIKKFMNYYLPTSLKLLRQYADFDQHTAGGDVIAGSKAAIEESMDAVVKGFEKQLDKLYSKDALNVSADITVLKNMLAQDGLDEKESPFAMQEEKTEAKVL